MDRATLAGRHWRDIKGRIGLGLLVVFCVLLVLGVPDGAAQPQRLAGLSEKELDELWPPDQQPVPDPSGPPGQDNTGEPSSRAKPDTRSLAQREADALKRQKEAIRQIQQLLKQPVTVPPPPSLEIDCEDDEVTSMLTGQLVEAYVKQASEPEAGLLKQLTGARRELQLLGADPKEGYDLESRLADRLVAKVEQVLKTTKNQRDKVLAVLGFAHRVTLLAQLLGDGGREQKLLSAVAAWLSELVPAIIKDIRTKHEYGLVNALIKIVRAANSAGIETGNVNFAWVYQQLEAALQFDLTLTFDLKSTGANGNVEEWTLKAEFPLKYTVGGDDKNVRAILEGSGTGNYARYADLSPGTPLRMTAASFPVSAKIEEFDACSGKAQLIVDTFHAESEVYIAKDGFEAPLPIVKWAWTMLHEKYRKGGGYQLDVPVTNRAATAVDTRIQNTMGVFDGTLTVKLVHKPK